LNSRLKKNFGRCFRLWIGGPQKKIVKIAGRDPGAVAWALVRYLTTPAAKEVFAAAGAE